MSDEIVICWFTQDLRLNDHPGFFKAAHEGSVLPIYIFDEQNDKTYPLGQASKLWLHHSLHKLNEQLNGALSFYHGGAEKTLDHLVRIYSVKKIFCAQSYTYWGIKQQRQIKAALEKRGVELVIENATLLWAPWEVLKKDQAPYKVFRAFYQHACTGALPPRKPLPCPLFKHIKDHRLSCDLDALKLLPEPTSWAFALMKHWQVGEVAAQEKLARFLAKKISIYEKRRDYPALNGVSYLSMHLHFGEISPNAIWYAVKSIQQNKSTEKFLSELVWREFCYSSLFHYPSMMFDNIQKQFDVFPWKFNIKLFNAWKSGQTGFPLIDAGMRELWQTGYMHNRVRMICASFLTKNLMIDWRLGAKWFWDCLIDADIACNTFNWQWVAGCGMDAAPYFRVFNPVLQAKKFDPDGRYIRKYVPELKRLENKYLFDPSSAPGLALTKAKVVLGRDYPKAIVSLSDSREKALEAFKITKS
ncbi:cryptochrome/photolyase family protein [Facilibium subflavum]|uniref:cryptochrome/photolyase family protein n=1 Tax=Facilibium subflavum TaxID=2219058 RepID=UPI000E653B31|nr:deoxyribodipyrimidine photo-lyase [Facilibium subflavum]